MSCRICETRKPRRYCPGLQGDICSPCCGTERENTVSCPLDCEYLLESRTHERVEQPDITEVPNRDIRVSEEFLKAHDALLAFLSSVLLGAALQVEGATDADVREALEAVIKTYRTRQSGLIYETKPENPYAAAIQEFVNQRLEQFSEMMQRESGLTTIRDADVLGVLVFLQRIALHWNNRRPRGRAFISFLLARQVEHAERVQEHSSGETPLVTE